MARHRGHIDYVTRDGIIDAIHNDFSLYDPTYLDSRRALSAEPAELVERIKRLQVDQRIPLFRSEQILREVDWLLLNTCDWNRLHRRTHELRLSLEPDQIGASDQLDLVCGKDGGFGAGTTEFYSKLDSTTDAAQREGFVQTVPFTFIKPLLDPDRLLAYLHRLLVSDIQRTGVNQREELASVESSMLQFLSPKKPLRALLLSPALWPHGWSSKRIEKALQRVDDTFADFIDQSQHPRTGFWGPWYLRGDALIKLHDLSYTFHVIHNRPVARWHAIIATLFEIEHRVYPYGWKPSDSGSPFSNHHNFDVAVIMKAGHKHVTAPFRRRIAEAMFRLTDWCLTQSLLPNWSDFRPVDEEDTVDRYAFGVYFLQVAGYWNATDPNPFWWDATRPRPAEWPDCREVARRLLAAVEALGARTSFVDDIKGILAPVAENRPTDRAPAQMRTVARNGRAYAIAAARPA